MKHPFFETILVKDHKPQYLKYHQKRLDLTFKNNFLDQKPLNIADVLQDLPQNARCRLSYSHEDFDIEFFPLQKREFNTFKIVDSDIDYRYKKTDRSKIDEIKNLYLDYDDVIFAKNSLLLDTSIANIALYKNGRWITPKNDLLLGTTKMRLLDEGLLELDDIYVNDLENCESFAIMNAILGFYIVKGFKFGLEARHPF